MNELRKQYALLLKKAQLYRQGGWQYAKALKRNWADYQTHLYAFLIDLNICLLPVYIWIIEFLLILCGIISPRLFDLLFYIMYGLLFLVAVIGLGFVTAKLKGQSIGYAIMDLKLVNRDRRPASNIALILRQALGIGLPLMIFGVVFQLWGLFLWILIHMCIVLATPNQQNLMDLFFKLATVRMPDDAELMEGAGHHPAPEKPASPAPRQEPVEEDDDEPASFADLHIRSNYSDDGKLDVEEIFKQAKARGVEIISITDHNCARANAPAMRLAPLYKIQYIPGVEFDCEYRGLRVRVLGYYIDWNRPIFESLERDSLKREKDASMVRIRKFEEYSGIHIDTRSLMESNRFQVITGKDITHMVFNNEQTRNLPFVRRYLDTNATEKDARRQFEHDIFAKGGPCYVKAAYPNVTSIIKAIHEAGGLAVLANWHLNELSDDSIDKLISLGLDGIEVFTPDAPRKLTMRLLSAVGKHKLFVTAGSDYHGPGVKNRTLGVTGLPEKGAELVRVFTKAASKSGKDLKQK